MLNEHEQLVGELRVRAGRRQREELVVFASRFEPRSWAIEGATGTGALLTQQLVAPGETVLDVPPTLSTRARLLDMARVDKTDAHDARGPLGLNLNWTADQRNGALIGSPRSSAPDGAMASMVNKTCCTTA